MKARYKPTQNVTLAHYEFRKLTQQPLESYDAFINRVKHEANYCQFQCNGNCTVQNTLIRDQIIYGVQDNEIRKVALNEQWNLDDLQAKGRQIEAATHGAAKIKKESIDHGSAHRDREQHLRDTVNGSLIVCRVRKIETVVVI